MDGARNWFRGYRSGTERGLRHESQSLFDAVGDYGILDAAVEFRGDYALFFEVSFGAVGSEADNAIGPDTRDAGDLHQVV